MNDETKRPSTAFSPDLDWSQIRETVRMLHLSVAQIEMAMRDGDDSINALSNSFTTMIGSINAISMAAEDLEEDEKGIKSTIEGHCGTVVGQMQGAIVAFQFYDKLSQRLSHVNHSLAALAQLVDDQAKLYSPYEWRALQQKIRSQYSMREEQAMFDAVLAGASIEDALHMLAQQAPAEETNDIELF